MATLADITSMYKTVLGRAPDAAGAKYWEEQSRTMKPYELVTAFQNASAPEIAKQQASAAIGGVMAGPNPAYTGNSFTGVPAGALAAAQPQTLADIAANPQGGSATGVAPTAAELAAMHLSSDGKPLPGYEIHGSNIATNSAATPTLASIANTAAPSTAPASSTTASPPPQIAAGEWRGAPGYSADSAGLFKYYSDLGYTRGPDGTMLSPAAPDSSGQVRQDPVQVRLANGNAGGFDASGKLVDLGRSFQENTSNIIDKAVPIVAKAGLAAGFAAGLAGIAGYGPLAGAGGAAGTSGGTVAGTAASSMSAQEVAATMAWDLQNGATLSELQAAYTAAGVQASTMSAATTLLNSMASGALDPAVTGMNQVFYPNGDNGFVPTGTPINPIVPGGPQGPTVPGSPGAPGTPGVPGTPPSTPTTPSTPTVPGVPGGTDPSSWDWGKIIGAAAPAVLGAYASDQQANSYKDIADKYMAMGAPYRTKLADLYDNPNGFLTSPEVQVPVQQGTDMLARSLSVKGNPIGSGNALQQLQGYSADQLFGKLGQEKDRLAGFGGLASYNAAAPSAASNAIGAEGNVYNAIGAGFADVFNPKPTLAQTLAQLKAAGY